MLPAYRTERLRGYLLEEQAQLRQQLANLTIVSHDANPGLGNHMADDATAAFDQATSVSLRRGQQLVLEDIDQALQRMAAGAYGLCQRCGEEIDFARLKAIPHATLCMGCQKLVEL
ncbi:MAG: conjugal transfer protein TraR [Chloroflexi bacterium HGW-Chloroflexi-1]|nr:MAG: conjugal transfer protein TraR [Chloroflexi bacterium HGW-Chloroflexi-1]